MFHNLIRPTLLLTAAIIALCHPRAQAQTERWYTSDGELSSSLITDLLYDSRGMLWLSTEDCLNRFDGSKFTIYRPDPTNPGSIASSRVNCLYEDRDGRLLVCTHSGVQVYDPATDSFCAPLKVRDSDGDSSPLSTVVQRSTGEIWVAGNEVYRIADDGGRLHLEHMDLPDAIRFIDKGIVDKDDNIWLSKHAEGVFRIAPDGTVRHYLGGPDDPVVTTFGLDADKRLYIGSARKGLYRYDPEADDFIHIDLWTTARGLSISNLYNDAFGNLLVASDGGGLIIYDPRTGGSEPFPFINRNYEKLKVHDVVNDAFGNLWVGVYQKGLLKLAKRPTFFRSLDQRATDIIGNCCVTALLRDSDGTLWVGTDNDDVFAVDPAGRTSRHYTIGVPKTVMALCEDAKGRIWLGSYNRGMGLIDRATGAFTPLPLRHRGHDVNHVYGFAPMADGSMLVATMGAGLFVYDPVTQSARRIESTGLSDWVTAVKVSDDGRRVYVGTYDGFHIFDSTLADNQWLLRGQIVAAIHEEPDYGDVWVGTNQGLVRIGTDGTEKRTYTTADGLPGESVQAIERGDEALWISTNNGLSKFRVKDGLFTNFTVDHGLPNNEFYRNSSTRDADGNIYFGGINGIAALNAGEENATGLKLTLRVTDFFLGNESVNAATRSGGHPVIVTAVTDAREFRLAHDDNSFAIVINTKEFVSTSQTDFYYSLDDGEWVRFINPNSQSDGVTLTFTKLASGRHNLRVKAVNAGVESDPLDIDILIGTVWYKTWWMKLVYALLGLALLYAGYRMVADRIRRREEEELRRHKAEVLESKLQFFTNISHEIRTPLSLVIGPLQQLIDSDKDAVRSSSYGLIMRNANRILRLVNELMDLRKIDNNQMKMHLEDADVCKLVGDVCDTFRHAAEAKHIDLRYTHPDGEGLYARIDKGNFDKIVMNLLSNAVKFTPEHGTVTVAVSRGEDPAAKGALRDYVELSVTDTGIGIAEHDRKNIFDRFYQASNNHVGGTGIGLHLTRQLAELHGGTIVVGDNPDGQGTRFTVRIPASAEPIPASETEVEAAPAAALPPKAGPQEPVAVDVPAPATQPAARGTELVYIVEDDEEIRRYLEQNLRRYFRTEGFGNGKAALEAMHAKLPDLVITDVMMPEMDGYTLARKIKQNINLNRTPVMILTAKSTEQDNLEAIEAGATVWIAKPFNIDVVVRTARNLVEVVARLRNAISGNQNREDLLDDIEVISSDDKLMERVMKVVNKNLNNSEITVEMIAREIGISRVHLHRKLKELTNQTTRDFIRNIRLQAAAKLLREKKLTVAEVSDLVGFKQANNFSTVFKETYGLTPTAYAAKYHTPQDGV